MNCLITSSILVLTSFAQNINQDWTCNNYNTYPVDICWRFNNGYTYYYECDGTDSITVYQFSDQSCGTSDPTPDSQVTYSKDDANNTNYFSCSESASCSYGVVTIYDDDDCTGDSYYQVVYVTDQCAYGSSSSSIDFECSGSVLTTTTYSDGNCDSFSSSYSTDYDSSTDIFCSEV